MECVAGGTLAVHINLPAEQTTPLFCSTLLLFFPSPSVREDRDTPRLYIRPPFASVSRATFFNRCFAMW